MNMPHHCMTSATKNRLLIRLFRPEICGVSRSRRFPSVEPYLHFSCCVLALQRKAHEIFERETYHDSRFEIWKHLLTASLDTALRTAYTVKPRYLSEEDLSKNYLTSELFFLLFLHVDRHKHLVSYTQTPSGALEFYVGFRRLVDNLLFYTLAADNSDTICFLSSLFL